jgi:hypothetical protein
MRHELETQWYKIIRKIIMEVTFWRTQRKHFPSLGFFVTTILMSQIIKNLENQYSTTKSNSRNGRNMKVGLLINPKIFCWVRLIELVHNGRHCFVSKHTKELL